VQGCQPALGELPGDTAIARLPGMVVTLKVSSQ